MSTTYRLSDGTEVVAPTTPNVVPTTYGPSGKVRVGLSDFTVVHGDVFVAGKNEPVGTLNDQGDFSVVLDGKPFTGNLKDVGAVKDLTLSHGVFEQGKTVQNALNGTVKVGDERFTVKNGVVTVGGSRIGTIDETGQYNVTINGQQHVGRVADFEQLFHALEEFIVPKSNKLAIKDVRGKEIGGDQAASVTLEFDGSQVKANGQVVGSVTADGFFTATVNGRYYEGLITGEENEDFSIGVPD
jgi:hypothetical protein